MTTRRRDLRGRFARYLGAAVILATSACAQDGLGDPTGSTCPANSSLTFESFGEVFMRNHCVRCHSDFSTQEGVQSSIDAIDRAAASGPDADNTYMPEGEDLAETQRKKLGEWLACGAPKALVPSVTRPVPFRSKIFAFFFD